MILFKHKIFISVVVYIRNNESEIEHFLKTLYGVLNESFEKFEIICANDASTDQSREIIKRLASSLDNCKLSIVNMSYYSGRESTMHAGVDLAIGDFVFEFDSIIIDYDSNLIMQVYDRSLLGFDIVSCGKTDTRIFPRLFYAVYNSSICTKRKIRSETFRILSRRAINRIHSMSSTLPYRKAVYSNSGLETDFIHYKSTDVSGKYVYAFEKSQDTALVSLIIFTDIAYRVSVLFSMLMALFMFGFGIYTTIMYFSERQLVEGWAPLMGLISAGFFGVFVILTIAIRYLDILVKSIFNKQAYHISSIDK